MGVAHYDGRAQRAISLRRVSDLKRNPRNPRRHSRDQIRQLANAIRTFGFTAPLLTQGDALLAGHARLEAADLLGIDEVPTIDVGPLTRAQAQALIIADNRLAELAEWDDRLLAEHLSELSQMVLDFNIEVTGFTTGEIDLKIEGLGGVAEVKDDPADAMPQAGPVVSRMGDLWLLGRHRVLCRNALDSDSYAALMDHQRAAMIFADPPFNVPIRGHASGLGRVRHPDFVMASGEMSAAEFTTFLSRALTLLASNSIEGSLHFICMDWRHLVEILTAGTAAYSELKNLCVWTKNNAGMGSLYRSAHELVLVFKHGTAPHRNNVRLGEFGRNRTNVWSYPGANSFGRNGDEGNLLALHPTVKPTALIADAIMDCTARGDLVLDGFLGSGTTVIAAERTGRRCFGLELDPIYVDTIVRRWQAYTGGTARHAETGKTFDEITAERS